MSPIESMFFDAFVSCVPKDNRVSVPNRAGGEFWFKHRVVAGSYDAVVDYGTKDACESVDLYAEVSVLSYRADFLIAVNPGSADTSWLAVECDGHDFHDRTKQQAAYDRARDRELLLNDITTIRYTGSELYHDANRCAVEAWRIIEVLRKRDWRVINSWREGRQSVKSDRRVTKADI